MSRKVFISFLGTNDYVDCNYYLDQQPDTLVPNVKFMPEALVQTICKSFKASDRVVILATEKAIERNYLSRSDARGLQERLEYLSQTTLQAPFECVIIKEGFTEEEIWDVFQVIDNQVQPNDIVYLDITHAFRYLPMLGVVLLNFLKVTKQITVGGVYYGAFEKLGPAFEVRNMPLKDRNAPVLNLLPMIELQSWANAAQNFSKYGSIDEVASLTSNRINPILKSTQGKDIESSTLRHFSALTKELIAEISTNRGKGLATYDFNKLFQLLETVKSNEISIKPLKSLFGVIEEKLKLFSDKHPVWLDSAKWCLQHNLIQQGMTQLQEGIIAYLVDYAKAIYNDEFYDSTQEKPRTLLSQLLNIIYRKAAESEWSGEAGVNRERAMQLWANPKVRKFSSIYAEITGYRNDVNHGGYTRNTNPASAFAPKLSSFIQKVEAVLSNNENVLVNLSNHPSENWPKEQLTYALNDYTKIMDLPFPPISSTLTSEGVERTVGEYVEKVIGLNPAAVHIMGEMTFTFRLVNALKAKGILCLASTTERITTIENNLKTSQFNFVQFRSY